MNETAARWRLFACVIHLSCHGWRTGSTRPEDGSFFLLIHPPAAYTLLPCFPTLANLAALDGTLHRRTRVDYKTTDKTFANLFRPCLAVHFIVPL